MLECLRLCISAYYKMTVKRVKTIAVECINESSHNIKKQLYKKYMSVSLLPKFK